MTGGSITPDHISWVDRLLDAVDRIAERVRRVFLR